MIVTAVEMGQRRRSTDVGDDDDETLSGGGSGPYDDCGNNDTFKISVF